MRAVDLRVYVITADLAQLGRSHFDIAAEAVRGGARVVQFRDKRMSDLEFTETAARIAKIVQSAGALFIVNDRVEIGIKVGADGIHVGRSDADVRSLRALLPAGMILGASATDYAEALDMSAAGADYLGVGPIFPTPSKDDATPPIGIIELQRICRDVATPVVAIGGIDRTNLPEVIHVGAAGAAVIHAIAGAPDVYVATREFRRDWNEFRCGRGLGA